MRASSRCASSRKLWLTSAVGAFAALALAGTAWTGEAPKPGPDEVFTLNTAIGIPTTGIGDPAGTSGFFSFDISWFDPVLNRYFLADRSAKSIDVINPANNSIKQFVNSAYAGFTGNNDTSGPDGVLTVDHKELWVGDSPGKVWVLNPKNGDNILGTGSFISTGADTTTRADEMCYDPRNHVVMMANPGEPKPFVSFISTTTHKVLSRLVFDGSTGPQPSTLGWPINGAGINATGGLEQCGWSPLTGKFYQNVPVNDAIAPAGSIAVINGSTMLVETSLPVSNAACNLPQGMAIGPNHQIMLGCNGPSPGGHRNTALMSDTGTLLATYPNLGGADEVWFNEGDGHYFIPGCNTACRAGTGNELLGVVDSSNLNLLVVDSIYDLGGPIPAGSSRRVHSTAAASHTDKVYVPIPANVIGASGPTLCNTAPNKVGNPTSLTGCIAVFTTKHDDHRTARERDRDDHQE